MSRRHFLIWLAALLAAALSLNAPALAKDGDGESDSDSDSGSGDDGGDEDDDGSNDGSDEDDGGSDDNSGPGSGQDDDEGDDDGDDNDDDGGQATAKDAVDTNQALPLRDIVRIFDARVVGTIVDVALMRRSNELHYRIKFIDTDGRVRKVYFEALTGANRR